MCCTVEIAFNHLAYDSNIQNEFICIQKHKKPSHTLQSKKGRKKIKKHVREIKKQAN